MDIICRKKLIWSRAISKTGAQGRRVTIKDLAKEADVSIATVSYVLNDRGSVGDEVKKRVFEAASRLGYRQNRAARAMKTGRTEIIGLVIPNIENPFFAKLSQSILLTAQMRNYQVFLAGSEGSLDRQARAIQGLVQQGVDGLLIFPENESVEITEEQIGVPLVVIDRRLPGTPIVDAEYFQGGCLLANHLLALGHKTFGLLDGPQNVSSSRDRVDGFMETIKDKGDILWRREHGYTMQLEENCREILRNNKASAIVCGNDQIAIAAMYFLQSLGKRVPQDVAITGYDDIPLAQMVKPSLTTIRMPTSAIGEEATKLLLRQIEEDTDLDESGKSIRLPVELVVRNSTSD